MRRSILAVTAVSIAVVGIGCQSALGRDGLDLVPGNAAGLFSIESLSDLHRTFGVAELREQYPDAFAGMTEDVRTGIGIDPLDLAALRREGFDPDKPVYVAFGPGPERYLAVIVPGDHRAMKWLRATFKEHGNELTEAPAHDGTDILVTSDEKLALFSKGSHIVFIGPLGDEDRADPVDLATRLLDDRKSGSIAASESYRRVMGKFTEESHFTFYMGSEFYTGLIEFDKRPSDEAKAEEERMLEALRSFGMTEWTAGFSARFGDDHLVVKSYSWMGADSPFLPVFRTRNDPTPFVRNLPSEPWMVYLARADLRELWKVVRRVLDADPEMAQGYQTAFSTAKEQIGVDLETELIDQLSGNLGLLVNHVSPAGGDALLLAQVSDPDRFRETLAKLSVVARAAAGDSAGGPQIMDDTVGDVPFYRIAMPPVGNICVGVVRDHLVATASRERFVAIAEGGAGFGETIASAEVRQALAERGSSVFYIDFAKLSRDAEPVLPMLGPAGTTVQQVLNELSEWSIITRSDAEGTWQDFKLTSRNPGIWKRLLELVAKNQS